MRFAPALALGTALVIALPAIAVTPAERAAAAKAATARANAAAARKAKAAATPAPTAAEDAPATADAPPAETPAAETPAAEAPATASGETATPAPVTADAPLSATTPQTDETPAAPAQSATASPPAEGATPAPAPTGASELVAGAINAGAAPTDDFGFVSWCAGAVEGYLRLKPAVMPEVRRIEGAFREPGHTLAEDLKVYDDLEKEGRRQRKVYAAAIHAAEKASPSDISDDGFTAYKRGLAVWAAPAGSTKARIAQEWMGWALPGKCEVTAKQLIDKSTLFGQALKPSAGDVTPADAGLKGPQ